MADEDLSWWPAPENVIGRRRSLTPTKPPPKREDVESSDEEVCVPPDLESSDEAAEPEQAPWPEEIGDVAEDAEKVGEEATEVILAAKDAQGAGTNEALVGEVADLWFHCMVLLSHLDLSAADVLSCLAKRQGISGLDEKASRATNG